MSQPASRAYVIAIALIGAIALAIITSAVLVPKLEVIEHRITTIEHHRTVVVSMPCVRGDDQACRRFVGLLLSDATLEQLRTLLRVEAIHVPSRGLPRLIGALHRLEHPRHHRRHHRRSVPAPLAPFVPIPPARPVTPVPASPPKRHGPPNKGVMPGHGNGLPGRPRQEPRSP